MHPVRHLPRRFMPAACCCAVAATAFDPGLLLRQWRADEQARRGWEEDKAQKKAMELHHRQMEGGNTCGPALPSHLHGPRTICMRVRLQCACTARRRSCRACPAAQL